MGNKAPAYQFYAADWLAAGDLQSAPKWIKGVWADVLNWMWREDEQGKLRRTEAQMCELLKLSVEQLREFCALAKQLKFADVTFRNENVTLINRRMHDAYLAKKQGLMRVRKHRKYQSNRNVTPYSSSSSSSTNTNSNNTTTKGVTFALQDVLAAATQIGIADDKAEEFYHHYNAQGWKLGNGQPITQLSSALVRWRNNQYKFAEKTRLYPLPGKTCSEDRCGMPAVYKSTGGAYDRYCCANHLPEKVRAKYRG